MVINIIGEKQMKLTREEILNFRKTEEKIRKIAEQIGIALELEIDEDYIEFDYDFQNASEEGMLDNPIIVYVDYYQRSNCSCCGDISIDGFDLRLNDLLCPSGFINKIRSKRKK